MAPDVPALGSPMAADDLRAWQRVRRYRVPRWMIEQAERHRRAGDWRGACAAARMDVTFTLDGVARDFGAGVAGRLAADLRHFVPDLLRWHLPRGPGDMTVFDEHLMFLLARYDDRDAILQVSGPPSLDAPQRLRLTFGPDGPHTGRDWTGARHLFDDRYGGGLIADYGGAGRLPFFHADGTPRAPHELPASDPGPGDAMARAEWSIMRYEDGDVAGAFGAAGFEVRPPADPAEHGGFMAALRRRLGRPPVLAARLRRLAAAGNGPVTTVIGSPYLSREMVAAEADGDGGRLLLRPPAPGEYRDAKAANDWHQPFPDADLLRAGLVAPDELHPLVRSALFPARAAAEGPVGPPDPEPPGPVRVRCRGEWHEVRWAGGVLTGPHGPQDERREQALRALGGRISGCFTVRGVWRTGQGQLPRALRRQRGELFLRAVHGDTPGVLRMLDAGMDPCVHDAQGRSLLHFLHAMNHRLIMPRLLAAGLDLNARDRSGRTPLSVAVTAHGSPALVRALLEAGADRGLGATGPGLRGGFRRLVERAEREDLLPLLDGS
ncbi:ankyrin repeat domain-containing protein [Actinomadura violacea]|uniref:Ankyrin repeat domain-containing protein n=1 Tax=Actinomadura violacea TaxID=2819934 RepID=A0ABS3RK80_9ACTN|nr:ankyrin repeat domain-containing protein [Actinomadura violacea]MBO2457145.1 hypothetical protein [Actinomadura violacea]